MFQSKLRNYQLNYFTTIFGVNSFSGRFLSLFLSKKKKNIFGTYRKKKYSLAGIKQKKVDLTNDIKFKINSKSLIIISSVHKIKDFKKKLNNYKINLSIVKNAIKFAKENNIKEIIYFSTIDINYYKWPLLKKKYILSKQNCEKILIKEYQKGFFKKLVLLRLPAIIGRNCNKNFLVDLFNKLNHNKKIEIWNYNKIYKNFIHIEELSNLVFYLLISKKIKFKIIECHPESGLKLIDLIKYAKKKIKSSSKIDIKSETIFKKKKIIKKLKDFKFKNNFYYFKKFLNEFKF